MSSFHPDEASDTSLKDLDALCTREFQPPGHDSIKSSQQPDIATTLWFLVLLSWTILLSFYCLDGGAEFQITDAWVAQTAREMQQADEWIVPRFSGETRLQKSPGAYWAVMLASVIRGQPVDTVAARLPNAMAAVLLVVTIFWLTRHIAGDRPAVFAGFAASSSILVLYHSHKAAADFALTALIALSLACLWVAFNGDIRRSKSRFLLLAGYFVAGLAMLYKMPIPLVAIGLPALCYLIFLNRRRVVADRWHAAGLILFLLPWLPWAIAVALQEPTALSKWRVEYLDRFTGALPTIEHQTHWGYYFIYLAPIFAFTLPYSLSLPAALLRPFRTIDAKTRDGLFFMILWSLSLLIFFTLSAGKEMRYIFPALPPLFVLLGCELSSLFDPQRQGRGSRERLMTSAIFILVPVGLLGGLWGLYRWNKHDGVFAWGEIWPAYLIFGAIFGVGFSVSAWCCRRQLKNHAFAGMVATMWIGWLWFWPALMPKLASEIPSIDFARQLRERIPHEDRPYLTMVGHQDARIVWHSDLRFPRIIDQLELLTMQDGRRSRAWEEEQVAREMIRRLESDEPALMVIDRFSYIRFMIEVPKILALEGRSLPPIYLWLQTQTERKDKQYLVIGNKPPPWSEPELSPPASILSGG